MVTGLQLALHSASAETRYELVFAKSPARASDALNPSLNLILLLDTETGRSFQQVSEGQFVTETRVISL